MPFPCVEGWPQDPMVQPVGSLIVAPTVVWTKAAASELLPLNRPGIALSAENIVITSADAVTAVDRRTGAVAWLYRTMWPLQYFSPPVVDAEGNIYVTRDSAVESPRGVLAA